MVFEPKVSVIIITFNQEKYIEEAINGVLMQECDFEYELIIANDHSYDGTDQVVQRIVNSHPKNHVIKYVNRDSNYGATKNFIDAIIHSRGEYIAFCEGDDYWIDPYKLQKQWDFLEKNTGYSMVCHDALIINQKNNTSKLFYQPGLQQQTFSTKYTLRNRHFCPTASIVFRKKSFIKFLDTQFIPFAGDHLLVQLLSLDGLLYRMKEVMSVYRKHHGGVSQIAKPLTIETFTNKIESLRYFNKISENKFWKNIQVEILIIKNIIAQSKTRSKYRIRYLGFTKRVFTKISKLI
jgi:glycosyltransferase involved in cell wall biosynthesis